MSSLPDMLPRLQQLVVLGALTTGWLAAGCATPRAHHESDAGQMELDSSVQQQDGATTDGARADGSAATHDAGPATDGGNVGHDAGVTGVDAGTAGADAEVVIDASARLDAGNDAGHDAGSTTLDAGNDGGADAGNDGGRDAGNDAGADGGADAGTDGGADAGSDAGADAGADGGNDAGADGGNDAGADAGADGGNDAGADAGPPGDPCGAIGMTCDANATCIAAGGPHCVCSSGFEGTGASCAALPTMFVTHVGTGASALTSASTAVTVDELRLTDGSTLRSIALPIATAGAQNALTVSGSASSEGGLSRSSDGHYVTLAGYATAPGIASVASSTSATVARVVGRIDSSGTIDTSTLLNAAFSGNNVRSATTSDGTAFWVAGAVSSVQYVALGSTGASTQIATAPTNLRQLHVFGGQLYVSASTGTTQGVAQVGSGLPTTAGTVITLLNGFPTTSGPSPYSFVMLDLSVAVAGVDTVYVAQDVAPGADRLNIQKWTFDGTVWTQVAAFAPALTGSNVGARGLAGYLALGGSVRLVATTSESAPRVVMLVDDGASMTPAVTVVTTSPANTAYRGVALAPVP